MITFTSQSGLLQKPDPPPPCPRCSGTDVQASMRTKQVAYYRCAACGHMWAVRVASERKNGGEDVVALDDLA